MLQTQPNETFNNNRMMGVQQTPLDRNENANTPVTSNSRQRYEHEQAMLPATIVGNDSVFERPYSSNESPIFNINMSPKSRENANKFDIMVIEQKKQAQVDDDPNNVSFIPP